jgi:hypothetical protein
MRIALTAGFTAALASFTAPALAQKPAADSYPSKPISIVIPFAAGGSSPEEFRKMFVGELAYWKRIIQENNVTLD